MRCQSCGSLQTYVVDTYCRADGTVGRRRICQDCGYKFNSTERYIPNDLILKCGNLRDAERILVAKNLCAKR